MLIIGMGLFSLGAEQSMTPIGIKSDAKKVFVSKKSKQKDDGIKEDQQQAKAHSCQDTQHTYAHKKAYSGTNCDKQYRVADMRDGLGKNLKIRFSDRDREAQKKTDSKDKREIFCACERCSNLISNWCHRLLLMAQPQILDMPFFMQSLII